MAKDPEIIAHQQWLGYVQPVGLVVSIPALVQAQAYVNRNIAPDHQRFLDCLSEQDNGPPALPNLARFTEEVLGWEAADLVDLAKDDRDSQSLHVDLPEYQETLFPTYAVRELEPKDASRPWMILIQQLPAGQDFDKITSADDGHWQATSQSRIERLLRETQVPTGILFNQTELRLVYAPRGENSGYMTFRIKDMAEVSGRPIFAALHMLLCADRLFTLPEKQRLPAILADSRKYQNVVSTQLAEQVLGALFELLRGFQAANAQRHGELLREVLASDPNHVYGGLLNVLMRMVFILFAEDRGLLSGDSVYANFYSVTGLFERLRADAGRYPDTMDQRYGAWAQLLTLFRMIYEGGRHAGLRIPARRGYLFDPDRYPFLEGRPWKSRRSDIEKLNVPHISDGVVFRVLSSLLILDGERLSYRTLDVEQIGSVYEAVMGFQMQTADGRSIAIKASKSHGAPSTINLEMLLGQKPGDRIKWLTEHTDQKFTGKLTESVKSAGSVEDLIAALETKIARKVTPNLVPKGAMVLQPSDERRRSGSHYTPRSLTEPIVRTAIRPILEQLGKNPTTDQILAIKICDPAMGSAAFLVETCRQLGDELVNSWHIHKCMPKLPPDEDELLHARRLIAQRCVYGVDKNPMAVDLAKLSLWLATLAKDHPFTFLDHSLRCGDSLVGLTREQIAAFHWQPLAKRAKDDVWFGDPIAERMQTVTEYRQRILAARDDKPYEQLRQELDVADEALSLARLAGDSIIAAYFSASKDRERVAKLDTLSRQLVKYLGPQGRIEDRQPLTESVASLRSGDHPLQPFHWQIEFPEVFTVDAKEKTSGGFDTIVGNPPFAGKNTLGNANRDGYLDWLKCIHEETHGNADVVAHFFRRAFCLLRRDGCFGLIATKTIGQGDTRVTGLRWICTHGGWIYAARRRYKWPGSAAVMVSVVHVIRGARTDTCTLDGQPREQITAYLFHSGGHDDPATLTANDGKSYQGCILLGPGFTFDDRNPGGEANSISLMHRLIAEDKRNGERIFPYIGVEDVIDNPRHEHCKFAIDFFDFPLCEAERWPKLLEIVRAKVKPQREMQKREALRKYWWHYAEKRPGLRAAIHGLERVLVTPQTSKHRVFALLPNGLIYDKQLYVFAMPTFSSFGVLQSRCHEVWSLFFGSSLEDRPLYTLTGCFQTFPFPQQLPALEDTGAAYYHARAALMVRNDEGLTMTYNRFHDPDEHSPDILKFRDLHAAMDRVVLEAYGWEDLAQRATCEFLLDYEDDEDEEVYSAQPSKGRGKKKPWRYRWPDDFRDEVLARLLELNNQRAEEERLAGQSEAAAAKGKKKSAGRRKSSKNDGEHPSLPGM